jgi:flagellar hook-length control protein FliK
LGTSTETGPEAAAAPKAPDTPAPASPAGQAADTTQRVTGAVTRHLSTTADDGNNAASSLSPDAGSAAIAQPAPDGSSNPLTTASLATPISQAASANQAAPVVQTAAAAAAIVSQATVPISGLSVAIAAHAEAGNNSFEIRLDPPELGRIDVRLDVDREGKVTSHVMVDRPETLDVLRRDAPQLQRSLEQSGLKTSDNSLQFSLRDQGNGGQNQNTNNGQQSATARLVVPDEDLPPVDAIKSSYGRSLTGASGIDIRV